ncbi:hypothetical protein PF001_g32391, partial [Phytophthora fragariae]
TVGQEADHAVEAAVGEVLANIVDSIAVTENPTTPVRTPLPAEHTAPTSNAGKRKRGPSPASRKRRRGILQDDETKTSDDGRSDEECSDEEGVERDDAPYIPACVVDADPNLMEEGADRYTGLNSDEDPDIQEEPEDEEDANDDGWDEDWDIGELTDESDVGREELPDSVCLSAAKDKHLITSMRDDGWEYDTSKFGPDPTYADIYDGPYGPSDSLLSVADDPLALLFYFLPPKLWAQIAVESNTYHRQSIPQRARTLR